jgi:hypothetical protein
MEIRITDDSLRSQLSSCSQPVDLRDAAGSILGRFIPATDPSLYEPVPPMTREELDRVAESTEWYTTEEVLRHLESL